MPRLVPLRDPIVIHLDGRPIAADRGEPAVVALLAAGRLALARSPKFHRPRGPACLRAACDGCLARVDDVPNVMTCRVPARDGMRIETQNVVGSRETDLLRAADWFFPDGMNHHELLAGVVGVQRVMQAFARRIAGLGRLPAAAAPGEEALPRVAPRRQVDVLVVGAGASGMAAALELSRRGRSVEVLEDGLTWGGCVRTLPGESRREWEPLLAEFEQAVASARIALRLQTTAAGIYGGDVLVAADAGDAAAGPAVEVVAARALVLAPGAHDGVLAFEGNDLPGVMSARSGCRLLSYGATPSESIAVIVAPGAGPFGEAYARARPEAILVRGVPVSARGSGRVEEITVSTDQGPRRVACGAVLVDAPPAPAFELCAQAGASLVREACGYVVRPISGGRIGESDGSRMLAVGEVTGAPLRADAIVRQAKALDLRAP